MLAEQIHAGHPLHSVSPARSVGSVRGAGLESGDTFPCQHAFQESKAKRNSFNTTILQAWFCRELSFFWHQGKHFKVDEKRQWADLLGCFSVSLTLARGGHKGGRENQNRMLHKACLYALGLADTC